MQILKDMKFMYSVLLKSNDVLIEFISLKCSKEILYTSIYVCTYVYMCLCVYVYVLCIIYSILWPIFMWYTGMWSTNGDQSGQRRLISMTSQWVMLLVEISNVMSQWVMTLPCLLSTYHGITMHNDVAMNIFYNVFSALCLIVLFYYG